MEYEVLIGTVKNEKQFEVNFAEKFYHIPEAVIPKNIPLPKYIALYFPEGTFGDSEGCIRWYGKVTESKIIKRGEITSLPTKSPEKNYYKFSVNEWMRIPHPIIRKCGGIYVKAFTNIEKLLSANELSELIDTNYAVARKIRSKGFSKDELDKIETTKDPVGVKLLTKRINDAVSSEKIIPTQITRYLLNEGYLKLSYDEKTKSLNRIPTEKGMKIGIESFWEVNKYYREYSKNYYAEPAQKFIIEHLNDIVMVSINEAYKNN